MLFMIDLVCVGKAYLPVTGLSGANRRRKDGNAWIEPKDPVSLGDVSMYSLVLLFPGMINPRDNLHAEQEITERKCDGGKDEIRRGVALPRRLDVCKFAHGT